MILKFTRFFSFVLILFLLDVFTLFAREPLIIEEDREYNPGQYMEVFEDPGKKLNIHDVTSTAYDTLFKPADRRTLNFGHTNSAYWIRFDILNNSLIQSRSPWTIKLKSATMDKVDFYHFISDSQFVVSRTTGNMFPIDTRDHIYHRIVFFIMLTKDLKHTVYMRFQNRASMTIALTIQSMTEFMKQSRINNLLIGIFIGIILIMAGYNIFMFFSLKDISYIYFASFLISFLFFILSYTGLAFLYLWPDKSKWNVLSIPIFTALMILSFINFSDSFLQSKTRLKLMHKLNIILSLILCLLIFLTPFVLFKHIILTLILIAALSSVLILFNGIYSWKKGYLPARSFALSSFVLLLGAFIFALTRLGILPSNFFTESMYMFGSIPILWIISQGLTERVMLLKEEKEKADFNLKESEASFKAFINAIPAPAFLIDKEKSILMANTSFTKRFNKEADDIIGDYAYNLNPEEFDMQKMDKINLTFNTGQPEIFENSRADKHFINYIYPVYDKKNQVSRVAVLTLDITKRKRAETMQAIMHNIANAVSQTTSIQELYEVIHFELSKLIDAKNFLVGLYDEKTDTISLPYMKDDKDNMEKVPAAGTISSLVIKQNKSMILKEKDMDRLQQEGKIDSVGTNSKIWLGVPLNVDKKPIGIIVVQSYTNENAFNKSDLSLLEFISNQIAESIKKKQSQDLIRILSRALEQSPALIMITDLNGNIEYVNPKFMEITGYTLEEVKGRNPRILKSGETPTATYRELWDTITNGDEWRGEFLNKKKSGELYWEFAYITAIKNEQNNTTHYIALKEDITERKKLQQQLIQSQKMESIGTLAGGIAHDFNNLLTVIKGYSDIALLKIDQNHMLHKDISAIRNASEKAENLTRQILGFSRKQIISPQIIDLNNIISNSDKMMRRLIGEDINMQLRLSSDLPLIKADPGQIEQIFINLIINARDAINTKTQKASDKKITIETGQYFIDEKFVASHMGSKKGLHLYFSVSDNGQGMTEEVKQKIFEPFFTTKGKEKGTGLGLATVYGIVKQNNGSIFVYSEPGEGTTFKIYWPATKEVIQEKTGKLQTKSDFVGTESILVVEDDHDVKNFACSVLSDYGYKVYASDDGNSALKMIHERKLQIDMLFTDLVMPEMSGKELAEKIQELMPDIRILYASGYTDNHIVHSGQLEKDVHFLQKPYTIESLTKKVREILDSDIKTKTDN